MTELELIRSKIYEIRGQKVMIDRDLAELYGVETRALNQAVKRNSDRFPEDFMFQLTKEEFENWKSQIVISSWGGVRKMPYAFTELGVAMLSSVLSSKLAIQMNIGIMRAFVAIRQYIGLPKADKLTVLENRISKLENYLEEVMADQNDLNEDTRMQLELINESLAQLQVSRQLGAPRRRTIGFLPPEEQK